MGPIRAEDAADKVLPEPPEAEDSIRSSLAFAANRSTLGAKACRSARPRAQRCSHTSTTVQHVSDTVIAEGATREAALESSVDTSEVGSAAEPPCSANASNVGSVSKKGDGSIRPSRDSGHSVEERDVMQKGALSRSLHCGLKAAGSLLHQVPRFRWKWTKRQEACNLQFKDISPATPESDRYLPARRRSKDDAFVEMCAGADAGQACKQPRHTGQANPSNEGTRSVSRNSLLSAAAFMKQCIVASPAASSSTGTPSLGTSSPAASSVASSNLAWSSWSYSATGIPATTAELVARAEELARSPPCWDRPPPQAPCARWATHANPGSTPLSTARSSTPAASPPLTPIVGKTPSGATGKCGGDARPAHSASPLCWRSIGGRNLDPIATGSSDSHASPVRNRSAREGRTDPARPGSEQTQGRTEQSVRSPSVTSTSHTPDSAGMRAAAGSISSASQCPAAAGSISSAPQCPASQGAPARSPVRPPRPLGPLQQPRPLAPAQGRSLSSPSGSCQASPRSAPRAPSADARTAAGPAAIGLDAPTLAILGPVKAERALLAALQRVSIVKEPSLRQRLFKDVQRRVHPDKWPVEHQELATQLFQVCMYIFLLLDRALWQDSFKSVVSAPSGKRPMVECMAACPPEFLSGPAAIFDRSEYLEAYTVEQPPVRHVQTEPAPAVIDVNLLQANLRRVKTDLPHPESKSRVGSLVEPPGLGRPTVLPSDGEARSRESMGLPKTDQTPKAFNGVGSLSTLDLDLGGDPQYLVPRDWSISARNTFVDVQLPQRPPLQRARTEPTPDVEAFLRMGIVESAPPPPPMLEFFETDDPFETPQMLEAEVSTSNNAAGEIEETAVVAPPPPPMLPLETFETDDPLERSEGALPPPAPFALQCHVTDDPLEQSMVDSTVAQQADWGPFAPDAFGDAGMPPPPLPLETFGTEDPFETPQPLAEPAAHSSEAVTGAGDSGSAFMNMYPMHAGVLHHPQMTAPQLGAHLMSAPLLPPPPMMAAPNLIEPSAPAAPLTAPSEALEDSNLRPSHAEMRERGMLCCMPSADGCSFVHWALDARKLESQDKQIVSPAFKLDLPGQGLQPFKMVLYPKVVNDGKHGAGFRKAKGKGRVVLKCEALLPADCADITLRISVGRDDKLQPPRGPAKHNFYEQSCQGLPKEKETWDLTSSVDEDSRSLLISLELAPVPRVVSNPVIWWDENA